MNDIVRGLEAEQAASSASGFTWPMPPYFECCETTQPAGPEPCRVRASSGIEFNCRLIAFCATDPFLTLQEVDSPTTRSIKQDEVKLLRLLRPLRLKRHDAGISGLENVVLPSSDTQAFTIEYGDGEVLRGDTAGYIDDRYGVFFFEPVTGGMVERCFAPRAAVRRFTLGAPVGEMLVADSKLGRDKIQAAIREQEQLRGQRLGELLAEEGAVSREEISAALKRQKNMPVMRLGEFLRESKIISDAQLEAALAKQAENRRVPLGEILVAMGAVDEPTLHRVLACKLGVPFVRLEKFVLDPSVVRLVSERQARRHRVVPLYTSSGELVLAMEDPLKLGSMEDIRFTAGLKLVPVMTSKADIDAALARCYGPGGIGVSLDPSKPLPAAASEGHLSVQPPAGPEIGELANQLMAEYEVIGRAEEETVSESDSTLVRLVNKMVLDARELGASDIHIESNPGRQNTRIRFRKDGVLREYLQIPAKFRSALVSRIKIMASLDISDRRRPQDGKINFRRFSGQELELRVATIPTANGLEDVVLRLLASARALPLDALGASPGVLAGLKRSVLKPFGLILVCGPTGSGKTTTLHSLLGHLNTDERKIWTAEDPVEITQPGLRQVQVHPRIGWTFASALRSLLRADPDVIMVGEMRDQETATMAVEASLTGHLVLSTLHTNSAAESIVRLLDLGVDPFTVSDSLIAVLAQRLVRKLCAACREPMVLDAVAAEELAAQFCDNSPAQVDDTKRRWLGRSQGALTMYRAKGCKECSGTGYQGRMGLHELLIATPKIKQLAQAHATASEIRDEGCRGGMLTLKQHGIEQALAGLTDLAQVHGSCGD